MTKQDLENLYQLTGEIQDIERQLAKLQEKCKEKAGDTVRDYRSGQGIPITIYGYSEKCYRQSEALIAKLAAKHKKMVEQKIKIEDELENINDATIRRIIRLRYFERMSWETVAIKIDRTKSGDAIRVYLTRYLDKYNKVS